MLCVVWPGGVIEIVAGERALKYFVGRMLINSGNRSTSSVRTCGSVSASMGARGKSDAVYGAVPEGAPGATSCREPKSYRHEQPGDRARRRRTATNYCRKEFHGLAMEDQDVPPRAE